jgi:hypothetical protein
VLHVCFRKPLTTRIPTRVCREERREHCMMPVACLPRRRWGLVPGVKQRCCLEA